MYITPRHQPTDFFAHPGDAFFFMSPFCSLVTRGCFQPVATPAEDGALLDGKFQQSIKKALKDARTAGISHPVIAGVIPFDTRQPSALFVPRSWQAFSHQTLCQQAKQWQQHLPKVTLSRSLPERDYFIQMVTQAINAIWQGQLDKIVLARLLEIKSCEPAHTGTLLAQLIRQNREGYNFCVPLPDGSRLAGASPELLIHKRNERFCSRPLAGSARREASQPHREQLIARQLFNSGKDRHEHHLVVESMRKTLQPRSRQLHIPDAPECIATPTLWHLATQIEATILQPEENALSLACLLHPTPALSGSPHHAACQLLQELEPFERGYFGGIVGWCDEQGNGEWAVAIRCGLIKQQQVRLFAGAGIVPASVPEAEWHETEIKLATMLHAFGING